ncbi:MAG TPA: lipoprotein insertase outer membrane protein LolB [Arenimonas sp.]|nr:lipoprotein insertase outer membrane protein LolB [Arenimonas sp.]
MIRRALVILLCALPLAACVSRPPVRSGSDAALLMAQEARESALQQRPDWGMTARVAIRAGGQGGSGQLRWQQQGGDLQITLSAPITRQGWRLVRDAGGVRLEGLDGGPHLGSDAESLLFAATGWHLPINAMAAWLRGARAGAEAELEFGVDGLPARLREQGWTVDYREWDGSEPARPRRIFAERPDASVRLVIERWDSP